MDTRGIYTDYNRWLVTGFKVFRLLILLVAFILLLLAALSTPVIKSMSLFNVDLKADVNAVIVQLDEDVRIDVGVWGSCTTATGSVPLNQSCATYDKGLALGQLTQNLQLGNLEQQLKSFDRTWQGLQVGAVIESFSLLVSYLLELIFVPADGQTYGGLVLTITQVTTEPVAVLFLILLIIVDVLPANLVNGLALPSISVSLGKGFRLTLAAAILIFIDAGLMTLLSIHTAFRNFKRTKKQGYGEMNGNGGQKQSIAEADMSERSD